MTRDAAKIFLPMLLMASAGPTAGLARPPEPPAIRASSDLVDRFVRGSEAILAAVEAAGGAQALRGMTGLCYALQGGVYNDIQGFSAARIGDPVRDSVQRIENCLDIKGARFAQTVEQKAESGFDSRFGLYWRDGVQIASRAVSAEYNRTENSPSPFGAAGAFMVSSRWLPPVILQRALQNLRSAAWIAEGKVDDSPADIVEFSFDEQVRFRLYITRDRRAIRRVETMAPDPLSGDDASIAFLSGAQTIGGVVFPERVIALRRGAPNQDFAMRDIMVNPSLDDTEFAPPADYVAVESPAGPPRAHHVAGRVYEVRGLAGGTYQAPFIIMDDFVIAYEAPLGLPATRQVIAEIRRVAGDKPIRYVVVSHFHADHAGGIGAYAEIGATVLSAEENRGVLERYAIHNRPRLQGQSGPQPEARIVFEAVPPAGRMIVDAAGNGLEIVEFADNSHVESMLALFDRQSGVFMGADHHINAVAWNPTFERTADWVRRESEATLILGVHDRLMSREAFLNRARLRPGIPPQRKDR